MEYYCNPNKGVTLSTNQYICQDMVRNLARLLDDHFGNNSVIHTYKLRDYMESCGIKIGRDE